MKVEVSAALDELRHQFGAANLTFREDDQGGAYVLIDPVELGAKFSPGATWVGFQIPALYPYADIYPVFMGANVGRVDGVPFQAPITPGHSFEGRSAIQISRRSAAAQNGSQKVVGKILKVLKFLEQLQ